MQAAHLAFISPESEATISAYLPLSPKEFSPSCTPKKTLLHSCTLLNSSKITISSTPLKLKKVKNPINQILHSIMSALSALKKCHPNGLLVTRSL